MAEVLVSVGTDHHPFDRLVRWVDAWAAAHPLHSCFVQYGTSARPEACAAMDNLRYEDLLQAMQTSAVIVSHGGPATIMDARACGRLPLVVPRRADLGEHVDDHQVRFSRWMAGRRQVMLAESEQELHQHLDSALRHPDRVRIDPHDPDIEASVRRFAGLVDGLLDGAGRR